MKKSELVTIVREIVQIAEKKKGVDGKACWKGYRYAGTKNGKDVCIKVKGVKEGYYENTQLEDEIQKYGYDSFEQFFADNPGAEEAVFDFIDQNLARMQKEIKRPSVQGIKRKLRKSFLEQLVGEVLKEKNN